MGTSRPLLRGLTSGVIVLALVVSAAAAVAGSPSARGGGGAGLLTAEYTVTFRAIGLPTGSSWSVTLNGSQQTSTSTAVGFREPAGSYPVVVAAPSGYGLTQLTGPGQPSQGQVNVSGTSLFTARFAPLETVSFEETGLPVNTSWSVAIRSNLAHGGPPPQHGTGTLLAPTVGSIPEFPGNEPVALAFDGQNDLVYVANSNASNLTVINGSTNEVVGSVSVGTEPTAVVYDSADQVVYVANSGSGNLSMLNASTGAVVGSVSVGPDPTALAVDAATGDVYVVDAGSRNISVVHGSTSRQVTAGPVGLGPLAIAFDPADGDLYVTDQYTAKVYEVDPTNGTVLSSLPVGAVPEGITYDPANGDLYVSSWGSHDVTVIDGATDRVVRSVDTGGATTGVLYCPADGLVWVSDDGPSTLIAIEGATQAVVGSVSVGYDPTGLAYDPVNGELYSADEANDSVSAVLLSSVTSGVSLEFTVVEGSWHYQVTPGSNTYRATPSRGVVHVGLTGAVKVVTFRPVTEKVIFRAVGLPKRLVAGLVVWNVNSTMPHFYVPFSSRRPTVYALQNGTYDFAVLSPLNGYTAVPASGELTVQVPPVAGSVTIVIHW